ncbi:fimbria/pilus outer membrane usher protein, partial [Enterobacter asburiae]
MGGLQGADHYRAAGLGMGASLGSWGAASVDVIGARAQLRGQGAAWRMRYSKLITATNTTLTVAGYRHATPGFATLDETLNSYGSRNTPDGSPLYSRDYGRMCSSTSLSVSQTLGDVGSFGLTVSRTDYWKTNTTNNSYGFSYGVGLPWDISLSLSQTETRSISSNGTSSNDHLTSLSLSIPLGSRSSGSSRASYQGTNGSRGQDHSLGINGSEFNNRLNWDVRQSRQSTSGQSTTDNSYMHVG